MGHKEVKVIMDWACFKTGPTVESKWRKKINRIDFLRQEKKPWKAKKVYTRSKEYM